MPTADDVGVVELLITSGLLGTIVTLWAKWRHDKKKAPLERGQFYAQASTQNVTDALAIAAEARATAQAHREQYRHDSEASEARHTREMESLHRRLDGLEKANAQLTRQVARLERDDRLKDEELGRHQTRITNLEGKLSKARGLVEDMATFVQRQQHTTGEMPQIDYTIFEP